MNKVKLPGRPKLEEYTEIDQLTEKMVNYCKARARDLSPAQAGAEIGVGAQQVEAWETRCPAVKELINQLTFDKDYQKQEDYLSEVSGMNKELRRETHGFMVRKLQRDECPWATAIELMKSLDVMAGFRGATIKQTVEAEEEEVSTFDLLKNLPADMRRFATDPAALPPPLASRKRRLKVTKENE